MQHRRQGHGLDVQRQAPGLDTGNVQHLVDQPQQVLPGPQDMPDLGPLAGTGIHVQQLGEARMAFSGVRSSWLMRERNSLLARLALSASSRAVPRAISAARRSVMSRVILENRAGRRWRRTAR